jgi:hypothetical protein
MPMSDSDRALTRLTDDSAFRARVLADARAALTEYDLSDAERERLLGEAEMMEARVEVDPLQATESDSGQSDAAGAKG